MIDLCDTEEQFKTFTVLQLKEKISKRTGYPPDGFRLIFEDKNLNEDSTLLCDYGIQRKSFIQMVIILSGGGMLPEKGDGGMGDKDKSHSMEKLAGL